LAANIICNLSITNYQQFFYKAIVVTFFIKYDFATLSYVIGQDSHKGINNYKMEIKMKKSLLSAVIVLGLSACASQPKDIQATYVSPNEFKSFSCQELETEMRTISGKVASLTGELQSSATNDQIQMGVGLVLFWPALLLLEGGDGAEAAEYALLKGKYDAAEENFESRSCKNYVVKSEETAVSVVTAEGKSKKLR
jgi:hypothetical protein